jgi:hypothetical protein
MKPSFIGQFFVILCFLYCDRPTLTKCGREDVSGYGLYYRDVKR